MMRKMKGRSLAALLSAVMIFTSIPGNVPASDAVTDEIRAAGVPAAESLQAAEAEEPYAEAPSQALQEAAGEAEMPAADPDEIQSQGADIRDGGLQSAEEGPAEEEALYAVEEDRPEAGEELLYEDGLIEDTDGLIEDAQAQPALAAAEDSPIHYDREYDRHMLPGWDGTVNGSYEGWVETGEGEEHFRYAVTGVTIISQVPDDPDDRKVINDFHYDDDEEGYWWYYRVRNPGTAQLEVTYADYFGVERSYTFTLYVGSDAYSVYMNSTDGRHSSLPGGSIELRADANHEYIDENGDYQCDDDGLRYAWSLEYGGDHATVTPDPQDPSRAVLQFRDRTDEDGWINEEVSVGVRILDAQGQPTEGYDSTKFWLNSGYCEVIPQLLDRNLPVGGRLENVEFQVLSYDEDQAHPVVMDDKYDITYEWHYDMNNVRVTENVGGSEVQVGDNERGAGNTFTITRLSDRHSDFSVGAYWKDDEGDEKEAWTNYVFFDKDCNIWFDQHDLHMISDAKEPPALRLDVSSLEDGWADRLDLVVKAGHWNRDWIDELGADDYVCTFSQDGRSVFVALTEDYLAGLEEYDNVRIWAGVYAKDADQEDDRNRIRETDAWFHIEHARSEYGFEWDEITMLPGWDHRIDRWQWARVTSDAFEDGRWEGDVEILDVTSDNESVAQIEYYEGPGSDYPEGKDHNWSVRAKSFGDAQITLKYLDWDGKTEKTFRFPVHVGSERYDMEAWAEGSDTSLPGGSIDLRADLRHHVYNPMTGERWDEFEDELRQSTHFEWLAADDETTQQWVDRLEYREDDPWHNTVTVHLSETPDDWDDGFREDLNIIVRAVSNETGAVLEERWCRIFVSDFYYEIWVPGFDGDLWPGEEQRAVPELRRYPSLDDGNENGYDVISRDICFRWSYDPNAVEITDENGDPVGNYTDGENQETDINLEVDFRNDEGEPDDMHWDARLWEQDTDFWFDTPGGNHVYTDGGVAAELNLENYENAPKDLYELQYEVMVWLPDENMANWAPQPAESGWGIEGVGFDRRVVLVGDELTELYPSASRYDVHASIVLKSDGTQIAETEQDYWISEAGFDYYDGVSFGNDQLFPGDTRILNGYEDGSRIRIFNSDYHDGEMRPFVITGVDSENTEEDPYDDRKVVSVEEQRDDQGRRIWQLTGVCGGEALITLSLDVLDPVTMQKDKSTKVSYRIWVGDFHARIEVKSSSGAWDVLKGGSIEITPILHASRLNQEFGYPEWVDTSRFLIEADAYTDDIHEDYDWDGGDNLVRCSLEERDGCWYLSADPDAPAQRVCIELRAFDYNEDNPEERWEIASERVNIEVTDQAREIDILEGWDESMLVGSTASVTPILMIRKADGGEEPYESDNLFYRFEWHESDDPWSPSEFRIRDAEGKELTHDSGDGSDGQRGTAPFAVTRLVDGSTRLEIAAYDVDHWGNEIEVARRAFYVTDDTCTASLVGKEGRGDDTFTWFYSNEEDIRLTPDLSSLTGLDQEKVTIELSYGRQDYEAEGIVLKPVNGLVFTDKEWSDTFGLDLSGVTQDRRDEITRILQENDDGGFHVLLRVLLNEGGEQYVLAEELKWVEMRFAQFRLEDDDADTIAGRGFYYDDGKAELYVEDADHPDGKTYEAQIILIQSDDEDVLLPVHDEGGTWRILPLSSGSADITYTISYTGDDGTQMGAMHTTAMHVRDSIWYLFFRDKNGENRWDMDLSLLPEEQEKIEVVVQKRTMNKDRLQAFLDENPDVGSIDWASLDPGLYDWTDVDPSQVDVDYFSNSIWLLPSVRDGVITAGSAEGETDVRVTVRVYEPDDTAHENCVWEMERNVHVRVTSRDVALDLSSETVRTGPGRVLRMEDLAEQLSQHFMIRSVSDPEWKKLDASVIWFSGEPDEYMGMTLSDPGYQDGNDYQILTVDDDILEQAGQNGELLNDGTFETRIRVAAVRMEEHDWYYAEDELRLIVIESGGTAQENLVWSIEDGVLSVRVQDGADTGAIPDYTEEDPAPWTASAQNWGVTKIEVGEGVTKIGENAFAGIGTVQEIGLPRSLETIAENAFDEDVLESAAVSYAGSQSEWEKLAQNSPVLSGVNMTSTHVHVWDAGTVNPPASEEAEGSRLFTCTDCGETMTEGIPKIVLPVTISRAPAGFKAKAAKKGKVNLTWKKFKQTKKTKKIWKLVKKIEIQYSTDPTFRTGKVSKQIGKTKTKYVIKKLTKGATFYFRIRYIDGKGGVSKWSGTKKVRVK